MTASMEQCKKSLEVLSKQTIQMFDIDHNKILTATFDDLAKLEKAGQLIEPEFLAGLRFTAGHANSLTILFAIQEISESQNILLQCMRYLGTYLVSIINTPIRIAQEHDQSFMETILFSLC